MSAPRFPIDCGWCCTQHLVADGCDAVMVAFLQPVRDEIMAKELARIARDASSIRAAAARVSSASTYLGAQVADNWTHT